MYSTGIVRKLDNLGRIVFPKELRDRLDILENEALEIFTEDNMILLRKYEPGCCFCQNIKNITIFKGKKVCPECLKDL